jgi:hypothetical protein
MDEDKNTAAESDEKDAHTQKRRAILLFLFFSIFDRRNKQLLERLML